MGGLKLFAQPPSYTLYPPTNLQIEAVECVAYATWDEPQNGAPPGILGYRIYRDDTYLDYVHGQDTTWFYDFTVIPGYHTYSVSAYYDLTPYGYPGYIDESLPEGPEDITITCCCPFPFGEYWDQGSFCYNDWKFYPSQGNWSISTGSGNPPPSAMFSGLPADTTYSYSLCRGGFDAGPWSCATIYFDYDIKLVDLNATGTEKFSVELFHHGMWHQLDLFSNTGSFEWESHHHEIPYAGGGFMDYRFRVFGTNSSDITCWYLDNIWINAVCHPPLSPEGFFTGEEVSLTWHPPACDQGTSPTWLEEEISYHDGNPGTAPVQSFDWVYGTVFDLTACQYQVLLQSIDFYHASMGQTGIWKYRIHVVEWMTLQEVATIGPFYTTGDDQWEEDVPLDSIGNLSGGTVGIFIQPMGNTPDNAYPRVTSDTSGPQGISLFGSFPNYAALTPSTTGDYLINLHILIPDTTENGKTLLLSPEYITQEVDGYNIYRSEDSMATFTQLNQGLITDTSYIDTDPPLGSTVLYYYITAHFNACESIPSDTVEILTTSIPEPDHPILSIFPNPATDVVKVVSEYPLDYIELCTYMGHQELLIQDIRALHAELDLSRLKQGVYIIKIGTTQGVRVGKIVVARE
ncbi:MAG: T9SS type A sorting domain-containing protein [Bacteroidota bacterium]